MRFSIDSFIYYPGDRPIAEMSRVKDVRQLPPNMNSALARAVVGEDASMALIKATGAPMLQVALFERRCVI